MAHQSIVVGTCGNKSFLFRESWLKFGEERQFDICLLFYHENINNPNLYKDADYFYHLKGFKYHMLHELFTKVHPEWLTQYEYFYFPDDDIELDTRQINELFTLSRAMKSSISQASLSKDSFCSWPMFRNQENCFCRYVGQIEVMAPLFSRDALKLCLESFVGNRSSWGVDSVWSKLLDYAEDKMIVFDSVIMKHTLPVGGGELYQKIGVSPHDEWNAITEKYGARKQNYREYGRLLKVDKSHTRLRFWYYQFKQFLGKFGRAWRDYDAGSRVKSRLSKMTGKKD